MGIKLGRLRRRRPPEEVEDLKLFDTLEVGPDVQSQFKVPQGKGRRRPPEEVEDLKLFDTLEVGPDVQSQFKVPQGKGMEIQLEESGFRSSFRVEKISLLHRMEHLLLRRESRLKESGFRSSYREEIDYLLFRMMDLLSKGMESQLKESGFRSSFRVEKISLLHRMEHLLLRRESQLEESGFRSSFRVEMISLLHRMEHLLLSMEIQLEESGFGSSFREEIDFFLLLMSVALLQSMASELEESGLRSSDREEIEYLLFRMMDLLSRILKANEKKDEEEADDGDGRNVGEEVTESGKQVSQQLHGVQTEEQHLVEEEANKIRVYEGTVRSEGTLLDLKLGAVHLTFPPDAVSEPTSIVVHKWKSSVCSPQLQEHEAIVSNVIEISTTNNEASQFNVGVKLVFSHCAPDLQGYELVIKRLIKKEINDWEEVEGTVDVRELSDLEDDYPNGVPEFSFPVVRADIAEWSIYTVICRLKPSPTYTISSSGGCFNHPDYPGVAVSVPKEAVSVESKFPMQLKVQEIPNYEFEGRNVYVGPILRISCTQGIEFLKPVTIQLPVAPRGEGGTIPDPSICLVRVLFLRSDGENKEWVEITDNLENPARFDGTSVTFQVKRFSGYAYIIIPHTAEQVAVDPNFLSYLQYITRTSPITASFFAYFRPSERIRSRDLLHLVCCPAHLRSQVKEELVRDGVSSREVYEISSGRGMIPGHDKAFVFVSGGISPVNEEYMGEVYLMLDASGQHRNQLAIRLISDQEYCLVEFRTGFANLQFRLPSRQMQTETSSCFRVKLGSPTDEDLQDVAGEIGGKWKALGRQLKIQESQLTGFDRDQPDEYEKAYAVLKEWKQRGGSENATYQILKEALCHALVGRRDLAEEFCCLNNSVS